MRNPIRRSKKIGLTQGGRVRDGVPKEKWSRIFSRTTWSRLSEEEGAQLKIIRENPSRDYFHPCSKAQILEVINRLPEKVTKYVRAVVLRRIPKKDVDNFVAARMRYSCVILNASSRNLQDVWKAKPPDAYVRHMKPWCDDWTHDGDRWVLTWNHESIRRYYLYHLLLHEIGHVNQPYYYSRTKQRESYAENFALEWARELGEL